MKMCKENTRDNLLRVAIKSVFVVISTLPLAAIADDSSNSEAHDLMHPINYIEIGGVRINDDSVKFGQYNGMDESGTYPVGSFDVRGGDAYGYGDASGLTRWQVKGVDLGLNPSVSASISEQGKWNLGASYDKLTHNLWDSYQTPYKGDMGGNNFVLPTGFGTVADTTKLSTAQKAAFHNDDISTTRENTSFTAGLGLGPEWSTTFDFNHLDQSGAKLMSFGAAKELLATSGEKISILPNPTDYTTDTVNFALNWKGEKGHMNLAYLGSFFNDQYSQVKWETYYGHNYMQTMSTPPDNELNQFNLTGGYNFTPKTKLAGGLSYGRNTQNEKFVVDPFMMITAPSTNSLDGLVVNTHGDLKLTNQTTDKLELSAGVKYDKHDNQTDSNIYNAMAIDGGNIYAYPNTPLSTDKTLYELAGDYRLTSSQHLRLTYNRENLNRWCNDYAVNANYPIGTECVVATGSSDDKYGINYKWNVNENVKWNVGYSYSDRNTTSDTNAITAMIGTKGNPDPSLASGLIKGINAGDYLGFHPWFDGSRQERAAKSGIDWQLTDNLSMGLSGKYTDDDYDTTYGVDAGNTWSLNFDTTYAYSEKGTVNLYATKENRDRDMTSAQAALNCSRKPPTSSACGSVAGTATALGPIPAGATWSNHLSDDDVTVGVGVKQGGFLSGKLDLAADFSYSLAKSVYSTWLDYSAATSGGIDCNDNGTPTATFKTCGALPAIKNNTIQLKLSGDYKLNKSSTFSMAYIFQQLRSNDYYYNGLQYGMNPTNLMPTNQDSGAYTQQAVVANYIYSF